MRSTSGGSSVSEAGSASAAMGTAVTRDAEAAPNDRGRALRESNQRLLEALTNPAADTLERIEMRPLTNRTVSANSAPAPRASPSSTSMCRAARPPWTSRSHWGLVRHSPARALAARDGHRGRAHLERARREWPLRIARGRADTRRRRLPRRARRALRGGRDPALPRRRRHVPHRGRATDTAPLLSWRRHRRVDHAVGVRHGRRPQTAPKRASTRAGKSCGKPTSGSMASSCWSCARTGSPASTCWKGPTTRCRTIWMAPTLPETARAMLHDEAVRRGLTEAEADAFVDAWAPAYFGEATPAGARRRGSRARRARGGRPCPLVLRPGGGGGRRVAADPERRPPCGIACSWCASWTPHRAWIESSREHRETARPAWVRWGSAEGRCPACATPLGPRPRPVGCAHGAGAARLRHRSPRGDTQPGADLGIPLRAAAQPATRGERPRGSSRS